jgi:DNA-binding MarR family transcriptional regulator
MSRDLRDKAELTAAMGAELRELSAATIMFHQAIADRLGMNVTDHKCAGILAESGPITAGELAERTGLTTGAITGVIDRLEKARFVRRAKDPRDRRRVVVEPILKQMERRIVPLFDSMARATAELCARYSAQELAVILEFSARAREMAYDEIRKLRAAGASGGGGARRARATKR